MEEWFNYPYLQSNVLDLKIWFYFRMCYYKHSDTGESNIFQTAFYTVSSGSSPFFSIFNARGRSRINCEFELFEEEQGLLIPKGILQGRFIAGKIKKEI